jgi:hypothetical protein
MEEIFDNYSSDKGLIDKYWTHKKWEKQVSELNRQFSNKEVQMSKKYMKKCSGI